jgi:RimJ/RimL family protein N-acetyltransferase
LPDDLVIRPLETGESELFLSYPHAPVPLVGTEGGGRSYPDFLARREYRPEWSWVALRDGAVVARAAWWAGPTDTEPAALDWFDPGTGPDRVEVGGRLLTAAHERVRAAGGELPEYHLFLPPAWREVPAAAAAANDRLGAAALAGLTPFVERLNYRWTRGCPVPEPPARLELRPASDAEALAVLRRILDGTLDAYSRRDVERLGADKAAEEQLAELYWYPAPRDWWRIGYDRSGEVAGIVVPTRNYGGPVIGFVGVVPEQRGHHYADDLLAEATLRLLGEPERTIGADTDLGNAPMAASFARAGYPVVRTRIVLTGQAAG